MDDKGKPRPEMALKRGIQVVATQRKKVFPNPIRNKKKMHKRKVDECGPFTPRGLLRHNVTEESAFTTIGVPTYTSEELQSALYMYQMLADILAIEEDGKGKVRTYGGLRGVVVVFVFVCICLIEVWC
jgi:hypothetical protein